MNQHQDWRERIERNGVALKELIVNHIANKQAYKGSVHELLVGQPDDDDTPPTAA